MFQYFLLTWNKYAASEVSIPDMHTCPRSVTKSIDTIGSAWQVDNFKIEGG